MSQKPKVSAIIIFLNAEKFIEEAIRSILAQSYEGWELLLIDDGSTDGSTAIAKQFAEQSPQKIYYLEHPDHQNYGKGASRNLGIECAKGKFIAFLDADDVWLPHKLEEQVAIMKANPEIGMLYGDTLYWYSWTGNSEEIQPDFIPKLGVASDRLIEPPQLLPLYLRGKAAVPCTCSILVKQSLAKEIGGFDETFRGIHNIYEDQAFYAKVCLEVPMWAVNRCWDKYRQHAEASMAIARVSQQEQEARQFYLNWLDNYLRRKGIEDNDVWEALRKEQWLIRRPVWLPASKQTHHLMRWVKKWLLRTEEWLTPTSIRHWLWVRR